ncbi:glutathione S-transferase family protein [Sulfitobacter sp. S190]|uniref:glutathione S-transferase family protein n=1 Tax=Sulfitobacter sp. S190 TaxID=2867022 RepID=UPI0021A68B9E|nr:glutathione S-transferase family protein [Sulfitobacter sp. S190]UWR21429.1 glutathione S-transferase family protein [Sulfitobacter sp. S190]
MTYLLHYAPDNASLIIRLALEHRGVAYTTALVDRSARAQETAEYRKINPTGLIPALETPQGTLFETGAILLWLADRHGGLGPAPHDAARGDFLKWFFFAANTVHPVLRMMFYPEKYTQGSAAGLRAGLVVQLKSGFAHLDAVAAGGEQWFGGESPTALDFYVACMLRWCALYPDDYDRGWFDLRATPALADLCQRLEQLPCVHRLQAAEDLGPTPFTRPRRATPPTGSAT